MITVIQACKKKDYRYQKDIGDFTSVSEVLTPEGLSPSQLRNDAVKNARNDVILFLDDDSSISQETIELYTKIFSDPKVQIAGGPALIRGEHCFKDVLSSFLAMGSSYSRYKKVGEKRSSSEQELILCNLAVRKSCFLSLGGLNESIYPWEENDFLIKAQRKGIEMIYDPQLVTTRSMTQDLKAFLWKIMSYGENRGRLGGINHLKYYAALFFIPLFFSIIIPEAASVAMIYFLSLFIEGLYLKMKILRNLKRVFFIFCTHITYCLGLWRGLYFRFLFDKRLRHFLYASN